MAAGKSVPKFWELDGVVGLETLDELDLEIFLGGLLDDGLIDEKIVKSVKNLVPGVAYEHSGNPSWNIRRMANEEVSEGGF